PQVAEKLGLPQLTYVEEVLEVSAGEVRVRSLIEGGYEIAEARLPLLFTVVSSANTPRPAGAKRLLLYRRAVTRSELLARHNGRTYEESVSVAEEEERLRSKGLWIHEWSAADIEADEARIGGAGSPTKVKKVESVVLAGADFREVDPSEEAIRNLVHELLVDHVFI
ncbi:MAG: electron transfer flavoprotein beta subunit/FixA family protein, partial [Deltaproteobacteria bacterium]|nr:electron transfer flavoprotein beta subunit/FixA family protein [Deltaproteobacteria bacterium]